MRGDTLPQIIAMDSTTHAASQSRPRAENHAPSSHDVEKGPNATGENHAVGRFADAMVLVH